MPQCLSTKPLVIEEADLLVLLKNKDKRGFDILYNNYAGALYGFINKTIASEALANETLEDVFYKILHDINSYDSSKTSFFAWMYVITRKLVAAKTAAAHKQESHLKVIRGSLKMAN